MCENISFSGRSLAQMERCGITEEEVRNVISAYRAQEDRFVNGLMFSRGPIRRDTTVDVRFQLVNGNARVLRVTLLEQGDQND